MGPDTVRHFTYSFFFKMSLTKLLFPTCLFVLLGLFSQSPELETLDF